MQIRKRIVYGIVWCGISASMASFGGEKATTVYNEVAGTVIMEMENTSSPLGTWVERTSITTYTGRCYLEFMGNNEAAGRPNSPLRYTFKVNSAGNYWISIRSHKRLISDDGVAARDDMCNDCYVRLEGDYTSGNPQVPLEHLMEDTKFWGNSSELKWDQWASKVVHEHKVKIARYQLKAGHTYTLVVSGRAQRFNLDRIVVTRVEEQRFNLTDVESPRVK